MVQFFKQTFGSFWGWLGISVGAISLTNLGVTYFELSVGGDLKFVLDYYRALSYPLFKHLLALELPAWVVDLSILFAVLYMPLLRRFYLGARLSASAREGVIRPGRRRPPDRERTEPHVGLDLVGTTAKFFRRMGNFLLGMLPRIFLFLGGSVMNGLISYWIFITLAKTAG